MASKYYVEEEDVGNLGLPLLTKNTKLFDTKEDAEQEASERSRDGVIYSVWEVLENGSVV